MAQKHPSEFLLTASGIQHRVPRRTHSRIRLLLRVLGVEAIVRMRMQNLGFGDAGIREWPEPFPRQAVPLTAASQRAQPIVLTDGNRPMGPQLPSVAPAGRLLMDLNFAGLDDRADVALALTRQGAG